MSERPDVSVVMSVYNGAAHLRQTIDSILGQEGMSLEFIIVNDGSTDQSPRILDEYAERDGRVRIIHQENQGLTRALMAGCAAAKGQYIARQDVGDVSYPDRLRRQVDRIQQTQDIVLVSCGTRFVGPDSEYLYDSVQDEESAQAALLTLDLDQICGPSHHGSTLFSRAHYERVGGYRQAFFFAQDLDLWIRLAEQGRYVVLPEVLYQASITVGAISGLYRKEQIATAAEILESASRRRNGLCDATVLERAAQIRPVATRAAGRRDRAKALYFIGVCLKKQDNRRASDYFKQALQAYPLHLKSAFRFLLG
jgi:glycosyltransferase involved in cell wall biosynthesis